MSLSVSLLTMVGLYFFSYNYFEKSALDLAHRRADFYRSTLEGALSRSDYLPFILSKDAIVRDAAMRRTGPAALNNRLAAFAGEADVDAIYVMDETGLTIAASNFADEQTFLGQSYGFRPYFQQAIAGGRGAYYAIGATTAQPGYFFAQPIRDDAGDVVGVVAVKVDLSPLQEVWRRSGERVLVENADGVVVLASDRAWLYRVLQPLSPGRRAAIALQKQFAGAPLAPIDWDLRDGDGVVIGSQRFLHAIAPLPRNGWRLHFLASDRAVHDRALLTTLFIVAAAVIALLGAIFLRSQRLTAALISSNESRATLERTNAELIRTRDQLATASKLAALGQVAAAVTHELGQPISAMRNYLAAAEMAAPAEGGVRVSLTRLGAVLARLENATRQLKDVARPERPPEAEVDLRDVLTGAQMMIAHDAAAAGAALRLSAPERPVWVTGDRLRLEQAAVNLARNAIAAMKDRDQKMLTLSLIERAGCSVIEVADTGPGLGARTIAELQEPFLTTRPSGEGMGLGLAITAAIMREHGGALSARDRADEGASGAVFTLSLPSKKGEGG